MPVRNGSGVVKTAAPRRSSRQSSLLATAHQQIEEHFATSAPPPPGNMSLADLSGHTGLRVDGRHRIHRSDAGNQEDGTAIPDQHTPRASHHTPYGDIPSLSANRYYDASPLDMSSANMLGTDGPLSSVRSSFSTLRAIEDEPTEFETHNGSQQQQNHQQSHQQALPMPPPLPSHDPVTPTQQPAAPPVPHTFPSYFAPQPDLAQHTAEAHYSQAGLKPEGAVCKRLQYLPTQRLPTQRRPNQKLNMERRSNAEALFIYLTGEEKPLGGGCKNCKRGHGPWAKCVTYPGLLCGACSNCWYNASGSRCSFQENGPQPVHTYYNGNVPSQPGMSNNNVSQAQSMFGYGPPAFQNPSPTSSLSTSISVPRIQGYNIGAHSSATSRMGIEHIMKEAHKWTNYGRLIARTRAAAEELAMRQIELLEMELEMGMQQRPGGVEAIDPAVQHGSGAQHTRRDSDYASEEEHTEGVGAAEEDDDGDYQENES